MDYLPGDCSLGFNDSVYTQYQTKINKVCINSATTTFLYYWNKTSTHYHYEYYLSTKSAYPSKFKSSKQTKKTPSTKNVTNKIINSPEQPLQPVGSLSCSPISPHPSSKKDKKDENWNQIWNLDVEIKNTIPRTTIMDFTVYVPKRRRAASNPYESKKPLTKIHHYPCSITF